MADSNIPLQERRGFLAKLFAIAGGCAALLAPAALGAVSFFSPLRQKGGAEVIFELDSIDRLPEDGTPVKFPVIAKELVNAWNRYPNETVGSIYLRRAENVEGKVQVEALQVVCPHAGCTIMYETDEKGGKFFCPCHSASFDLSGKRTDEASPSPRDMDSLDVEIVDNRKIRVKFRNFSTGTAKKTALS
jgi:menaquinol-cytochrome c reductase iron-sulfur subunit